MKDIVIFVAGIAGKSVIGFFIGDLAKTGINHERELIISSHVLDNHKTALKICELGRCISL